MKKLCELLNSDISVPIERITDDSRVQGENILFCAAKGYHGDGHDHAPEAVQNGAVAVICEHPLGLSVPEIIVENSPLAMNMALNEFYDRPLDCFKLIGVTGTDGKTTTTTLIYRLLNEVGRCGFIGTKRVACPDFDELQAMTTPFPCELFSLFDRFAKCGCNYVAMEATSERLGSRRLDGLNYAVSVFTNISNDHLDSHGSLENYVEAKTRLFMHTDKNGVCVAFNDDPQSEKFKKSANGRLITYGRTDSSDLWFDNLITDSNGLEFDLHGLYGERHITSSLIGEFNALDIIAAAAAVISLGIAPDFVFECLSRRDFIESKQQFVHEGQPFTVIVDFAHTANAVGNLIRFARATNPGKLYMVLGTGGNRALLRQTELGKTVIEQADFVWLSTYNPRGEEPLQLCMNMLLEADTSRGNYEIELDRRKAIFKAVERAEAGDVILITGKGAEKFQLHHGVKTPYEGDYENAAEAIRKKYK